MISIVDDIDPVIVSCAPDVTVACITDVPAPNPASVVATDNCSAVTVTFVGDQDLGGSGSNLRTPSDCIGSARVSCFQI